MNYEEFFKYYVINEMYTKGTQTVRCRNWRYRIEFKDDYRNIKYKTLHYKGNESKWILRKYPDSSMLVRPSGIWMLHLWRVRSILKSLISSNYTFVKTVKENDNIQVYKRNVTNPYLYGSSFNKNITTFKDMMTNKYSIVPV